MPSSSLFSVDFFPLVCLLLGKYSSCLRGQCYKYFMVVTYKGSQISCSLNCSKTVFSYWGLYIKNQQAVIYGFRNKLQCLYLNTRLGKKGLPGQTLQLITKTVNYGRKKFYDTSPRLLGLYTKNLQAVINRSKLECLSLSAQYYYTVVGAYPNGSPYRAPLLRQAPKCAYK